LIGLFFALFLQSASTAQTTLYRATSSGRYTLSGSNTVVNVNAYEAYYASTRVTSVWGTMSVVSSAVFASTAPASASFSSLDMFGTRVTHAVITSKPFTFTDYTTYTSFTATLVITLTQVGLYGQGGFQIINSSDGAVVTESLINRIYGEVPFLSGTVTITE
jgi:hypothetical protein